MKDLLPVAAAIVRRDARVFWSYRLRPARELIATIFTVALFYELAQLISNEWFATPSAYFEFAAVGLALTPLLRSGLVTPPAALREELLAGTVERLMLAPAAPGLCLLATLVFPLAQALTAGTIILLLAGTVFGLDVQWPSALLALPLGVLAALALAPFGALLLAAGVLVKQVNAAAGWMVAGLALVGGVYFPTAVLPAWIEWAANVQPVTPALALLRHALTGAPVAAPAGELAELVAFAVVGLPLAAAALGTACSRARRRGTLFDA